MKTDLFDYELPESLIAFHPPDRRDGGRLMVLNPDTEEITHAQIRDLPALLPPGSLLVANDTRVIPARVHARRETGGQVEILFVRPISLELHQSTWLALLRANRAIRPGQVFSLVDGVSVCVIERRERGETVVEVNVNRAELLSLLHRIGEVPLPPYIRRAPEAADVERYQTVFAAQEGSVAAPTAGLHFSDELMGQVRAAGHNVACVTLHVGPGTFRPVTTDDLGDHVMDEEFFVIDRQTATAIRETKEAGRPVVAVGTTVVRTLEGAAAAFGELREGEGFTRIFILPPYTFKVTDGLLTNFHLPRSTLLCLVSALAGREFVLRAYAEAVREKYRFYSYGDAMLILPSRTVLPVR